MNRRPPPAAPSALAGVRALAWVRARQLANLVGQAARETPLKLASTVLFMALIWAALYLFFYTIFDMLQSRMDFEWVVAIPLVFHFFFVALTVLLIFSNGILMYGTLFGRAEAGYLFTAPIAPRSVVLIKFIESLVFSSWSLILLGLPLMMAMSQVEEEPAVFYLLFLGLFIAFVPIPGAIGLLAAWAAGMWFPRTAKRWLTIITGLLMLGAATWLMLTWHGAAQATVERWLTVFLNRMDVVKFALLPSTWVSKGIDFAVRGQIGEAALYLFITVSNALFLSWAALRIVSPRVVSAYAHLQSAPSLIRRRTGWSAHLGRVLFALLPPLQRELALKDLRTFVRDPLQWSQLAILFGLMALYVVNVPQINPDFASRPTQVLISFLNLGAVSLILATFTSRFVFPLISLEGHQLWVIGLLPLSRRQILVAKFAFSLGVTLLCALSIMGLSIVMLRLPLSMAAMQLTVTTAACVALCGLAVGMGALMPVFRQRNPTRIAGGFGGTVNLLLSVAYVIALLGAMGYLLLWRQPFGLDVQRPDLRQNILGRLSGELDLVAWCLVGLLFLASCAIAWIALRMGAKNFDGIEV